MNALQRAVILTHEELNRKFLELDEHQVLRETVFRGWLAWPFVKGTLWHTILAQSTGQQARPAPFGRQFKRLLLGILDLLCHLLFAPRREVAVLYTPRKIKNTDEQEYHPFLGRLLNEPRRFLECIYWEHPSHPLSGLTRGKLRVSLSHVAVRVLSWPWRAHPNVRHVAAILAGVVAQAFPQLPKSQIELICRSHLALFVLNHAVFRWIFWRSRIRCLIAFDADMKCSEIAAAKSLGLPVCEIQHGMFSRDEPEFSWTAAYRGKREIMPVPDKVLVFGSLWKRELLRNGFWGEQEVICVGYAAIAAQEKCSAKQIHVSKPIRVLFPTQYYVRSAALDFWRQVLESQEAMGTASLLLRIKIHPSEQMESDEYRRLAHRFPMTCEIVDAELDGLQAIVSSDVVAGYTSFMLLEAVGLGKPAISLCGGASPEGIAGTFRLSELREYIDHCTSPQDLLRHLGLIITKDSKARLPRLHREPLFFESESTVDERILTAIGITVKRKRVLIVSQRPSDFNEMNRVAASLSRSRFSIIFLHHSCDSETDDDLVVASLRQAKMAGAIEDYVLVPHRSPPPPPPRVKPPRKQSKMSYLRRVLGFNPRFSEKCKLPLSRLPRSIRQPCSIPCKGILLIAIVLLRSTGWIFKQSVSSCSRLALYIQVRMIQCLVTWRQRVGQHCLRVQLVEIGVMCGLYTRRYRLYLKLVRQRKIDVLILPEDVVGMTTPLLTKIARRERIASLIVPYTIANQQEAFRSLATNDLFQTSRALNRYVGRIFPRWRMRENGTDLVRLPAPHIVAHQLLGVAPPDPWMMNSGHAQAIAVENEAMRDYYLAGRIKKRKLRVVGAVYDDALYRFCKQKEETLAQLREELGIRNSKPFLLIGGCPNQLAGHVPGCEFDSLKQAAGFIAASLEPLRSDFELVVRPHPNYPELGEYFRELRFHTTMRDTAQMVAICDLYIAFASATIRWAIACGIPTINYDLFHYDYDDYKSIPGVFHVSKCEEFRETVAKLRFGGSFYHAAKSQLLQESRRWSILDGQSVQRIESLIYELSAKRRVA